MVSENDIVVFLASGQNTVTFEAVLLGDVFLQRGVSTLARKVTSSCYVLLHVEGHV